MCATEYTRSYRELGARAHRHKHVYGETFTCKLAGPISTKEIPIKGISPASTAVAVVTVARPHACTHVRVSSHVCSSRTRAYRQKPHTPYVRIANARSCTRSHTSRKRNRVGGGARMRMRMRTTTTKTTTTTTRTMRHTYTSTLLLYHAVFHRRGVKQPSNSRGGAYSQP